MEKPGAIAAAIKAIVDEKGIPLATVIETVEAALAAAYRKDFGKPNQNIKVEFNIETGTPTVSDVKEVVEDALKAEWEEAVAEAKRRQEEGLSAPERAVPVLATEKADTSAVAPEEEKLVYHPRLHIALAEAKEMKADAVVGEQIITPLEIPAEFGRMAAQTAKQVIVQKLREAERGLVFEEFREREGEVIQGAIQRRLGPSYLVEIGKTAGLLVPEDQLQRERYMPGSRFKFLIRSVTMGPKGPEILLSRTHPNLVRSLFSIEIPEIANGSVEVMNVAREPGDRAKIAVRSLEDNVDPIGSCVGQRGSRVQTIITELGGEKIDIIEWNESAEIFVKNALAPAKASGVTLREDEKVAKVQVAEDQLSLAIGRGGQNVRLASALTGWRIDIEGTAVVPEEGALPSVSPETTVEPVVAEEVKIEEPVKVEEPKEEAASVASEAAPEERSASAE